MNAINLTGNEFGQSLYGNAGDNVLNGGGGNDYLVGLVGNDYLRGGDGADAMRGGLGNVTIFGQSGGGRKVSTLMAMPVSIKLVSRLVAVTMISSTSFADDLAPVVRAIGLLSSRVRTLIVSRGGCDAPSEAGSLGVCS